MRRRSDSLRCLKSSRNLTIILDVIRPLSAELAEDIRRNGLLEPIVTYHDREGPGPVTVARVPVGRSRARRRRTAEEAYFWLPHTNRMRTSSGR